MNNGAMNIHVPVFEYLFSIHLAYILRGEIARTYSNPLFNFSGTSKLFSIMTAVLHSHQPCTRVPISLHRHHHFFSVYFFNLKILAILLGVKWCLTMNLICISLVTNDVKHHFTYLLAFVCIFGEMSA